MIGIDSNNKYEYQVIEVGLAPRDLKIQWECRDDRIHFYRVALQAKGTDNFLPFIPHHLNIITTEQPKIGDSYFMRFGKEE